MTNTTNSLADTKMISQLIIDNFIDRVNSTPMYHELNETIIALLNFAIDKLGVIQVADILYNKFSYENFDYETQEYELED